MIWITLLMVLFIGPALGEAQPAGAPQPDSAYLETSLATAADLSPVYPTRNFPPVKEVLAAYRLAKGESYRQLNVAWVAVNVRGIPPNTVIAKDLFVFNARGAFGLSNASGWPAGSYRVDAAGDGKPWKSVEFAVTGKDTALRIARPDDLVPLAKGKQWTYGLTVDTGAARAPLGTITYTVTEVAEAGSRILVRRDGAAGRAEEMWWRMTPSGLAVSQPGTLSEALLAQPQVWLRWPLQTPASWEAMATDQSFKQTYRMWGPAPVRGPGGEAPGYVVLTERKVPQRNTSTTVERHFLPGIGMVRQVTTVATSENALRSREELVLTDLR